MLQPPVRPQAPVLRYCVSTASTVLMSALEGGEPLVIRDTLAYFGRGNAGGQDLLLPADRQQVRLPGRQPSRLTRTACHHSGLLSLPRS
jgi:hypothetical protein